MSAGIRLKPHIEIRQFTGACELVRMGSDVSIVSELDAQYYVGQGVEFRPFVPNVPHKLSLVRPVHRHPSKLTLEFLTIFEDSLKHWRVHS